MDPRILALYDEYTHAPLPRRAFLERLAALAGSATAASALLPLLENNYAQAAIVEPNDPRVATERVRIKVPSGEMLAYVATPRSGPARRAGVVVIHENRGLNPHIEDIARRLATDGFLAFAPDALFPLGGYPGDEEKAREVFPKLDQAKTRQDFIAGAKFLKAHAECTGHIGAVGFCYGGGMVNYLATQLGSDLSTGVAFYGSSPDLADVPKIKAPLMIQSAENDQRINDSWPGYEAALKAAGAKYERYLYAGTQHGFNNNTTPRFDAAAAKLAWDRTVAFFRANVK